MSDPRAARGPYLGCPGRLQLVAQACFESLPLHTEDNDCYVQYFPFAHNPALGSEFSILLRPAVSP